MTLHLLYGRWWPIVCPPFGVPRNIHEGCINGSICTLLLALTYPQWYTRLHVVHLVTQGNRGLPDTLPRAEELT